MKRVFAVLAMIFVIATFFVFSVCASEDGLTTEYGYKEKEFTFSTEEMEEPWTLYDITTTRTHSGYIYTYAFLAKEKEN